VLDDRAGAAGPAAEVVAGNLRALRGRRLPKRAAEVVAADLEGHAPADWVALDTPIKRQVEDQLARELELSPGSVYLDFPEKSAMFHLHLLVQRSNGEVFRLGPGGREGLIALPGVADELYRTARVLRLFTADARRKVSSVRLIELACSTEHEVAERIGSRALLG